jgi:hypothetical protein
LFDWKGEDVIWWSNPVGGLAVVPEEGDAGEYGPVPESCASVADRLLELPVTGEKLTAWKLLAMALKAVIEPWVPPDVLGVSDSVEDIWFAVGFWDGVSTFRDDVRLSDALDEDLLLWEPVDL